MTRWLTTSAQRLAPALLLRRRFHARAPHLVRIPTGPRSRDSVHVEVISVQLIQRPAEFLIGRRRQPLTGGKSFRAFPFHLSALLLMSTSPVYVASLGHAHPSMVRRGAQSLCRPRSKS